MKENNSGLDNVQYCRQHGAAARGREGEEGEVGARQLNSQRVCPFGPVVVEVLHGEEAAPV